jgi:hypothetical protein
MNLRDAWCRETSSDPDNWTADNPAWGQCAVTALVLQDLLGGFLLRCVIGDYSHYALGVPKGGVLDATREQFAAMEQEAGRVFDMTPWETRPRSYVLSRLDTEKRYGLLRNRVVGKWG